jgi:hypothetical protein
MTMRSMLFAAPLAALALAACAEEEEKTYEVDATDESGGDLIVRDVEEGEVPVDVPEVEMTNVPPEETGEGEDTAAE